MAKITITVEDNPNGETVKVVSSPDFATMTEKSMVGSGLTYAEGYAISALLHLRKCSDTMKRKPKKSSIIIPSMGEEPVKNDAEGGADEDHIYFPKKERRKHVRFRTVDREPSYKGDDLGKNHAPRLRKKKKRYEPKE